jgi:hypothetical protein
MLVGGCTVVRSAFSRTRLQRSTVESAFKLAGKETPTPAMSASMELIMPLSGEHVTGNFCCSAPLSVSAPVSPLIHLLLKCLLIVTFCLCFNRLPSLLICAEEGLLVQVDFCYANWMWKQHVLKCFSLITKMFGQTRQCNKQV